MWSAFFGGNNQEKKELPKKAIVNLREQIGMLKKKQEHTTKLADEQDQIARKNVATNKTAAKNALKRKKVFETNLAKIDNQIESLETQLYAIESANLNLETMKAMQQGAKAMKQIHGDFNIDKVDATMDDIREQVELSEEISEAISRPLGQEVDEDELDEELELLQQEELDNKMVTAGTVPAQKMPDVPNLPSLRKPVVEEEDEDEEALRALQAEMGL